MDQQKLFYKQYNNNKILEFKRLQKKLKIIQDELEKIKKENLYQKNIIDILFSNGNIGEHDERILKTLIVHNHKNAKNIFDDNNDIDKVELLDHNNNVISSCDKIKKTPSS